MGVRDKTALVLGAVDSQVDSRGTLLARVPQPVWLLSVGGRPTM